MQFYVADYLGDTRHLTTEQHGAYLLLLMTMWRAGGTLPNDPKKLARLVGCTPSRWARIEADVMAFFAVEGDFIVNKRLTLELKKASEKSNQRAVVGSLGGKAKALKDKETGLAKATDLPWHSSESESEITTNVVIACPKRPDDRFDEFWKLYPRKVAKTPAHKAYLKALKETDHGTLVAGLTAQIGWGIFAEPKYSPHAATWLGAGRWSDERDGRGKGVVDGANPGAGRSGVDDIASIVARRHAEDDARMEVPGRQGSVFRDDSDWSQGAIEGEYRPGDSAG